MYGKIEIGDTVAYKIGCGFPNCSYCAIVNCIKRSHVTQQNNIVYFDGLGSYWEFRNRLKIVKKKEKEKKVMENPFKVGDVVANKDGYVFSNGSKELTVKSISCPSRVYFKETNTHTDIKYIYLVKRAAGYRALRSFTAEDLRKSGACSSCIEEFIKHFGFTKIVIVNKDSIKIMEEISDCIPFMIRNGFIEVIYKKEFNIGQNVVLKGESTICKIVGFTAFGAEDVVILELNGFQLYTNIKNIE